MKKELFILSMMVLSIGVLSSPVFATGNDDSSSDSSQVNSITLSADGAQLKWAVDGESDQGFKVVWSKNTHPVYPNRDGDKYHYYSEDSKRSDTIEAFDGSGTYYVRVCEYLGGKCGVYSNELSVTLTNANDGGAIACTMEYAPVCGTDLKTYSNKCMASAAKVSVKYVGECGSENVVCTEEYAPVCGKNLRTYANKCKAGIANVGIKYSGECEKSEEIKKIEDNAELLKSNQLETILAELKELRSLVREQQTEIKYLKSLMKEMNGVTEEMRHSINSFITYGIDDNTKKLGEGERAAVMHSYKEAFGKLPKSEKEMSDLIMIANGRYPTEMSEEAEAKATKKFVQIYKRMPDMDNAKDKAAVTVMAYGLRQKAENRNLASEKSGIGIYKNIFGRNPITTEDWNLVQAITYSGATR